TNSCPPPQPGGPRYSAAAPVYESYLANLKALNQLPTLTQRVGDRYLDGDIQATTAANAGETTPSGIWGRIEGAHNRLQSASTAGDLNQNINTVILQAGLDGQFYENDKGRVIAGLTGQYGNAHSKIDNLTGDGSGTIDTQAWGLGANATFYGNNGFYLDAQAQANWYGSDLDVDAVNRGLARDNKGFGYALSLEAGQRLTLDANWSLTPQAQLMWSSVDFDSFTDSYGARISSHEGDNLNARLGLAANYQNSFIGADGRKMDTAVYGIANLYQSLIGENRINYAGTRMASDDDKTWAGIGFGGRYAWADNKYALYGEGSVNTSLNHFADSYSLKGNLGFKVNW
ncbi:autotransporter outer membrane beta-barrel domain-containing protein, partial [Ochrobactrum quorumnocens]